MPGLEFFPFYSEEMEERVKHIELWASTFSGRRASSPASVEQAAVVDSSLSPSGTSSSTTTLIGDANGPATANSVDALRGKLLTGTEAEGEILVYTSGAWAVQDWVPANLGVGLTAAPTRRFEALEGITEMFFTNTGNTASSLKGLHINKTDDSSVTSVGITFETEGNQEWEWGIDVSTAANGRADLALFDRYTQINEVQQVTVGTNTAGQFKLTFTAQQTGDIAFNASAVTVLAALEALSNIAVGDVAVEGNAGGPWLVTFLVTYANTNVALMTLANGTTPLSGGSGQGVSSVNDGADGADITRVSHGLDSSVGSGPKFSFGVGGTPQGNSSFALFNAGDGLEVLDLRFKDNGGTLNAVNFVNRSVTKKRAIYNWNNSWQEGVDYQNTNIRDFYYVDSANSRTRVIMKTADTSSAHLTNRFRLQLGTNGSGGDISPPNATLTCVVQSSAAADYDKQQCAFYAGFNQSLNNRGIYLTQVLDATTTVQYLFLGGGFDDASGAPGTRASPKFTSASTATWALRATDSEFALETAAIGTGQTPVQAFTMTDAGLMTIRQHLTLADGKNLIGNTGTGSKIGAVGGAAGEKWAFFGSTPIVQPLLATGAGATADSIITVLQNLGLCRQS